MKLKRIPEDFQVTELTDFQRGRGPYALYFLTKRSLGTPEAIESILRRWNIARPRISYGGLKDRHALTQQYVTIKGGPPNNLREDLLELEYLGQATRPFEPQDISGNRFLLVLRDLNPDQAPQIQQTLADIKRTGLPNYFDDQRFGSLGASGEFVAQPWCLGNYERALWLALADPNVHDRPDERQQKQTLRDNWGNWQACKKGLDRSHRRSVITFLADRPGDFRGAIARLRVDLRSLYLAAFQSAVWNRMLATWIRQEVPAENFRDFQFKEATLPFYLSLPEDKLELFRECSLPLPSARLKLEPGPTLDLIENVLQTFGLELRQVRVKYPRDSFFSKGDRNAIYFPRGLRGQSAPDDIHPGRHKWTLQFDLPRGSYATILVKRLTEFLPEGTPE
ncbi:MAG: tRNA pseudouridine(13) synthase TruD [Planctomycetales bacterium]